MGREEKEGGRPRGEWERERRKERVKSRSDGAVFEA